ncbi:MAG: outer membrane lipoprotein chaperone LolA [Pseudomonadota bacterium]
MNLLRAGGLLSLLVFQPALADITPETHPLLDEFVSDMQTLQGRFEQSLVDADGRVMEVTRGTLQINRPDRFRWTYSDPYEQHLIADGANIWSYDVDLAQVTVKPQLEALANTPALLLGGADDALDQFDYEGGFSRDTVEWVQLAPKNTESGFLRVELGFVDGTISQMVFYDHLDQTTLVNLFDVSVNRPIDPARFEFVPPDDVDVVGTPAAEETAP